MTTAQTPPPRADPARQHEHPTDSDATQGNRLRNSLITILVLVTIVVVLLFALPGLHQVSDKLRHASVWWLVAAVALELLSCLGYVAFFGQVFYRGPRRLTARIAWAELAANAVLPAGGAGGLGLGGWMLHAKGMPTRQVAERSVVVFLGTSAVNVVALIIVGVGMFAGAFEGPRGPLLTLLPAAVGVAAIAIVLALPPLAGGLTGPRFERRPRLRSTVCALAVGVRETLVELRRRDLRVLGAVGYWVFDTLVLWACFRALGASPGVPVVMMAYLIGQLGGELPIPGGLGAIDAGLVGALALYGVELAPATAAVLAYRAISLWLPALIGSVDFVLVRRRLDEPVELRPAREE
ncbi:MAG: lysylphosphatidylglycerol synthase transmembrane domain-containing protein [Solirubrobacteraceae bacterium]